MPTVIARVCHVAIYLCGDGPKGVGRMESLEVFPGEIRLLIDAYRGELREKISETFRTERLAAWEGLLRRVESEPSLRLICQVRDERSFA